MDINSLYEIRQKQFASVEQQTVLRTLAESVTKQGCRFLEIGSWLGDSAIVLGKVAKENGGLLFCVDWWKGSVGTELIKITSKVDAFSLFWERICAEGLQDVVVPIRTLSDIASQVLREDIFDLVFIDGDHRYDWVLKDIRNYAPLVAKKGILCGHDCEGKITDYEMSFLEEGKNVDCYEAVHCGVVLAVGSTFKDYSINWGIWSVKTGKDKKRWKATNLEFIDIPNKRQPPPPVIDCAGDYNLTRYGKYVYAFSHLLYEIDSQNIYLLKPGDPLLNEYLQTRKYFIGKTVEEVKRFINGKGISIPRLLESYQDYNLIRYKDCIYAVWQGFDLDLMVAEKSKIKEYQAERKMFVVNSIDAAKKVIDQKGLSIPKLLESYQDYNLARYKDCIYAVWQGFDLDLTEIGESEIQEYQAEKKLFVANSIDAAKKAVDQKGLSIPKLLESYQDFNLIRYKSRFYAVLKGIDLDLTRARERMLSKYQEGNELFIADSIDETKECIRKRKP